VALPSHGIGWTALEMPMIVILRGELVPLRRCRPIMLIEQN